MRIGVGLCGAALLAALVGCGPVVEGSPGALPGPICYTDDECVPNGCCGRGTGVVHVQDAPDCRGLRCDGSCPAGGIDCGCGLPICRDGRCAEARTVSAECP